MRRKTKLLARFVIPALRTFRFASECIVLRRWKRCVEMTNDGQICPEIVGIRLDRQTCAVWFGTEESAQQANGDVLGANARDGRLFADQPHVG